MHIHLDPVGGLAGDMFLAAVLHAWPELEGMIFKAIRTAGLPDDWSVQAVTGTSAGIAGMRVEINGNTGCRHHATGSFREIRERLESSALRRSVSERAVAIFQRLAEAESEIHGKPVEEVHFHEIADWDSVADIVGASAAIEAIGASGWSVGDIPMGSGTVMTAHGKLPVPAPATALLLRGLQMVDDGISGERVTPTGAAILAHLGASQRERRQTGHLARIGHGLGMRTLKGCANMLRLLAFEPGEVTTTKEWGKSGEVGVISFDVDDQSPEDLAVGIEVLRSTVGTLDVVQFPVTGKKGRLAISIRVLCRLESLDRIVEACFLQTTTIGLRWRVEQRVELNRNDVESMVGGAVLGGKKVHRPDGRSTIKVDMDALANLRGNQRERAVTRRLAEGDHGDDR